MPSTDARVIDWPYTRAMDRTSPLELVNPQVVFRGYAAGITGLGVALFLWGPMWLQGELNGWPFGLNVLVRLIGAACLVVASATVGLARCADGVEGRRALWWFVGGHWVFAGVMLFQGRVIWGYALPHEYAIGLNAALLVASVLLAGLAVVEDRGRRTAHALTTLVPDLRLDRHVRSRYEDGIRKAAALEERTRFARDLHDAVKQQLFAIQTSAATAAARLGHDPAGAAAALVQVRDSARDATAELHTIIEGLRAAPIELSGLQDALRRECEAVELRTGARVALSIGRLPPPALVRSDVPEALFRIAQEALSNVARHARATRVQVSLQRTTYVPELRVDDNGSGCDPAHPTAGQGLANMRARAAEAGGWLEIAARAGGGTSVLASMPIDLVEPTYFRARAIGYTAAAAVTTTIGVAHLGPVTVEMSFLPMALFSFNAIRYLVAWRRATRITALTS